MPTLLIVPLLAQPTATLAENICLIKNVSTAAASFSIEEIKFYILFFLLPPVLPPY